MRWASFMTWILLSFSLALVGGRAGAAEGCAAMLKIAAQSSPIPLSAHYFPKPRGAGGPEVRFAVGDPMGLLPRITNPFPVAVADPDVHRRLEVITSSLVANDERIKVYVDEWNTWIVKASNQPHLFTPEELASPTRFSLIFLHPVDEHPELIFHGVVTQVLFDCFHHLPGNFQKSWNTGMTGTMAFLEEARLHDPQLEKTLTQFGEQETRRQIEEILKLRIAWILKFRFYTEKIQRHPVLASAPLPPPHGESPRMLENMATLENTPNSEVAFGKKLLEEFVKFYSQNQSQRLSPHLIRAVWEQPLPGLWESPIVFPSMIPASR